VGACHDRARPHPAADDQQLTDQVKCTFFTVSSELAYLQWGLATMAGRGELSLDRNDDLQSNIVDAFQEMSSGLSTILYRLCDDVGGEETYSDGTTVRHDDVSADWPHDEFLLDDGAVAGQTVWWLCDRRHEWQAMINNRRKARGCPQCTLWGTSVKEIRLRHELLAAGVPIDANHEVVHAAAGKVLQCDMLCSAWNLAIEFDGNRFHKLPANTEKDERKTRMLAESGWTLIRVREDLPPIGEHEPLFSNETTRAKATLEKLHSLGFKAAEYDAYLETDQPWGSDAAATYIKRRQMNPLQPYTPKSRRSGIQRRTAY
jgi:Probable Zinc-ribbon domain